LFSPTPRPPRSTLFPYTTLFRSFDLPSLRERPEDIEPNVEYELEQFARRSGHLVRFSAEARDRFMRFASGSDAAWLGNFRDLSAAITRMATLAPGGRITVEVAAEEIERLRRAWAMPAERTGDAALEELLGPEALVEIDPFDQVQLAAVVRVCRECQSLSEAGRKLFAASRKRRSSTNDADRLRKYLARFGLPWERVRQ